MEISDRGVAFICQWEKFAAVAYHGAADRPGVMTIGYGHVIRPGESFGTITEQQARDLMLQDCAAAEDAVERMVQFELEQYEFDALVSFVFNVGVSQFTTSTLLQLINAGDFEGAAGQFKRWNRSNGKVQGGLIRRRAAEESLFRGAGGVL